MRKRNNYLDLKSKCTFLVSSAFNLFKMAPPDLRQIDDEDGEILYVKKSLPSYLRTVEDLLRVYKGQICDLNIIELGAYLGIVSKSLSLGGAKLIACDIPEFFNRKNVQNYYLRLGIPIQSFNLKEYKLPFPDESQDCVIACEVFEHLNFNPLPVIAEINRVLKPNGVFYIAMPNAGFLIKRLKFLLLGEPPGFNISELYAQLNPKENMVVGLHWKEYTVNQTIKMVTPLGFKVLENKMFTSSISDKNLLKNIIKEILPSKDTQILIFRKSNSFKGSFEISQDS